jgi:hypothetical protein
MSSIDIPHSTSIAEVAPPQFYTIDSLCNLTITPDDILQTGYKITNDCRCPYPPPPLLP